MFIIYLHNIINFFLKTIKLDLIPLPFMISAPPLRIRLKRLSLAQLSIQQRLPLFICILLLLILVTFSWMSYIGVRKASLAMGEQRLTSLTEKLSSLFKESMTKMSANGEKLGREESIQKYMNSRGKTSEEEAIRLLSKFKSQDTLSRAIQVFDSEGHQLFCLGNTEIPVRGDAESAAGHYFTEENFKIVGKIVLVRDSMYYPVITKVNVENKTRGYLLNWRVMRATKKSNDELEQVLGDKGRVYFGNNDGQFWTDMIKPVKKPPVEHFSLVKVHRYVRTDGNPLIGSMRSIPNSDWLILVEFSSAAFLETANTFLRWEIFVGIVLVVAGSYSGWLFSRNLVSPLNKLSNAASALANGDYSSTVDIERPDELGHLARSFHSMAIQVHSAKMDLEQKVLDRTHELELANKELEAFSYSVSHDLRIPLRAVYGYSVMLKDDFQDTIGAEGNRVIRIIIQNAKMMGSLIDDLLAFSRLGRRKLGIEEIDMNELVIDCIRELREGQQMPFAVQLQPLPECKGDRSMLKQVWMNLLGNAFKYSAKKDNSEIVVGFVSESENPGYFVKDNGIGFDMQYADKLFGVFQRLHSNEEFEGTGVGLALVKRIIDKHHGTIHAKASPGNGATFYFSLPS